MRCTSIGVCNNTDAIGLSSITNGMRIVGIVGIDLDLWGSILNKSNNMPTGFIITKLQRQHITHIKIWGRLRQMTCNETDRAMFIVDGDAVARVGDEEPAYVGPGDFILIPRGTSYELKGDLTYLVINSPAYREGSDLRDPAYDGPPARRD